MSLNICKFSVTVDVTGLSYFDLINSISLFEVTG